MGTVRRWLKSGEQHTLVWLARSRASSFVIVGTLAAAGLGAAAVSGQSSATAAHQPRYILTIIPMQPMAFYGCSPDPDSDGHSFCDGSTPIAQLPASFGQCLARPYYEAGSRIICRDDTQQPDLRQLLQLRSN
jgi:hypothetical protein